MASNIQGSNRREFLKTIGKLDNTIIAESALRPPIQGFENFGHMTLADKYKVKLVDLDQEKYQTILAKKYQLGRSIQQQLRWKEAARVTAS